MDSKRVNFKQINFGFASAEVESSESPDLLREAFFDPCRVVPSLLEERYFLVLGNKGTGKSAVGFHLSLIAEEDPELFVNVQFLGDLSYGALGGLVRDDIELELRYPKAWTWLLLLLAIDSLSKDQGVVWEDPVMIQRTIDTLGKEGLLPVDNFSDVVGASSNRSFEFSAWGFALSATEGRTAGKVSLGTLSQVLKTIVSKAATDSTHLLVIDGLDDVLLSSNVQLHALSGLILEASRLNQFFREHGLKLKIVVLCRTDIFERLPGPNQNKIRQDLAVELRWYEETGDESMSNLVKLINRRAELVDSSIGDVIRTFFPTVMKDRPTLSYLLRNTRHTPRDFIQLLTYIQEATQTGSPTYKSINLGSRAYADRYFLPELRNEMEGTMPQEEIDRYFSLLRQFHRQSFMYEEFRAFVAQQPDNADTGNLVVFLKSLFNCSGVGNVAVPQGGNAIYSFKYRSPAASFNQSDAILCHFGLSRALQLQFVRREGW